MEKEKTIQALDAVFNNEKLTENGDRSYKTTTDVLLDILFTTEYLRDHPEDVPVLGSTPKTRLFARFLRDPRDGMGCRDLGRTLMAMTGCTPDQVAISGRYDDVWRISLEKDSIEFLWDRIMAGDELAKKWAPRWQKPGKGRTTLTHRQTKTLEAAKAMATARGLKKSEYGRAIKAQSTVEYLLSMGRASEIKFEHVPSLASIKYAAAFARRIDTKEAYAAYLERVAEGSAVLHVSTTTPYNIYRNRETDGFDADLFFRELPKVAGSWLPIIDTSGSMCNPSDSIGKAISIGHYLSVCSTYAPLTGVTFSERPVLYKITGNTYCEQIKEIRGTDWGFNTDLGAVMRALKGLSQYPEFLVILSDMEFDQGSADRKDNLMQKFKELGAPTKIVWWNFNGYTKTIPETDSYGNVYMSGYSPMLLKYLQAGFDGTQFLEALLKGYAEKLGEEYPG